MHNTDKQRYMSGALRNLIHLLRTECSQKYDIIKNEVMIGSQDRYKITLRKRINDNNFGQSSFIYETFNVDLYKKAVRLTEEAGTPEEDDLLYNYFVGDPLLKEHVYGALNDLDDIKIIKTTLDECKVPKSFVAL